MLILWDIFQKYKYLNANKDGDQNVCKYIIAEDKSLYCDFVYITVDNKIENEHVQVCEIGFNEYEV